MTSYTVVPGSVRHIRPMAASMRHAAAMALDGYGFNPREALRRAYVASHHCRTAMIDGKPVAMWGAAGALLSDGAYVWLVLSDAVRSIPRAIVREARADLAEVMERYPRISATVLPDDEDSVRFARFLGFSGEIDDPEARIPMGDHFAIRMTYRPEAH